MNLSNKMMAYWVFIFLTVFVVDKLELMQKFAIDDKSLAVGFFIGAILMKLAPNSKTDEDTKGKKQ